MSGRHSTTPCIVWQNRDRQYAGKYGRTTSVFKSNCSDWTKAFLIANHKNITLIRKQPGLLMKVHALGAWRHVADALCSQLGAQHVCDMSRHSVSQVGSLSHAIKFNHTRLRNLN